MAEPSTEQQRAAPAADSSTAGTTLPRNPPGSSPDVAANPSGWCNGQPAVLPLDFGRYRIDRKIGQGGMGIVYLGIDKSLERPVAIKIPTIPLDSVPNLRERFFREAKLAATLRHANLCPVYDFGQVNGIDYLVMAYIEGRPLSQFVRPGQTVPARNVATVVRCLAQAMFEAHKMGVIHRDLKPANIMIATNKQPVIMDFGLAKRTDAEEGTLVTKSGAIMGTPEYMPPEQLDGDLARIGPRTDVYALGVILYELLAGQRPFQGPLTQLIVQVVSQAPPSLRKIRPELDATLEAICFKALAKNPIERFADMREFAAALSEWLASRKPDTAPLPVATQDSVVVELFDAMAKQVVKPQPMQPSKADSMYWAESTPKEPIKPRRRLSMDKRRQRRDQYLWARLVAWIIGVALALLLLVVGVSKGWSGLTGWQKGKKIDAALIQAKSDGRLQGLHEIMPLLKSQPERATSVGDFLANANDRNGAEEAWVHSADINRRAVGEGNHRERGNAWWKVGIASTGDFRMHCLWYACDSYGLSLSEEFPSTEVRWNLQRRMNLVRHVNSNDFRGTVFNGKVRDYHKVERELKPEFAVQLTDIRTTTTWEMTANFGGHIILTLKFNDRSHCEIQVNDRWYSLGQPDQLLLIAYPGQIEIASRDVMLMFPIPCEYQEGPGQLTFILSPEAAAKMGIRQWNSPVHTKFCDKVKNAVLD